MKDMFSIGELASYQNISKQTLIYYDKIGLFKPAYVDPDNKYRPHPRPQTSPGSRTYRIPPAP